MSLPDYDTALRAAMEGIEPVGGTERIELERCLDRTLADPVTADRDLPPFNRAQMDGYALRAADLQAGCALPVVAAIPAGAPADLAVPEGACVQIATGAPLPADLDTVVQHELSDLGDPVRFTIDAIEVGHAVHPRGADARAGDVLIKPGTRLMAHHLGIAASVGAVELPVHPQPAITIITTGDEVRPPQDAVEPHQIRNSNGPQLRGLLGRCGGHVRDVVHVVDDENRTIDAVRGAIEACDLVVTVGGVSAGRRDFLPIAFERCDVRQSITGAAIQPGKPVRVGSAPNGTIVVALPGNPVSVLACACLFAWPIIRRLAGGDPELPWLETRLDEPVRPNPRRQAFRPAIRTGPSTVRVPSWAGSGDLAHTAPTHGLARLVVQEAPMQAGDTVLFLQWP